MALKELVADQIKVDESQIEAIVADFIRYDPSAYSIVWLPKGRALNNEGRILVYLVAIMGWRYVVDDAKPVATNPNAIENSLGIKGGTLRPILSRLKDQNLLRQSDGNYEIQIINLDEVERMVSAASDCKGSKSLRSKKCTSSRSAPARSVGKKTGVDYKSFIENWIAEGYFADYLTLSQILEKFHEHAVITKQTTLSGIMMKLVQQGLLMRKKITRDGKSVWGYTAK